MTNITNDINEMDFIIILTSFFTVKNILLKYFTKFLLYFISYQYCTNELFYCG